MLENYKGKFVRILVSSESGAGISGDLSRLYNSMIVVFGTIKGYDANFLELENSTVSYYSGAVSTLESTKIVSINDVKQPAAFENKSSILNLDKIILISVVE